MGRLWLAGAELKLELQFEWRLAGPEIEPELEHFSLATTADSSATATTAATTETATSGANESTLTASESVGHTRARLCC